VAAGEAGDSGLLRDSVLRAGGAGDRGAGCGLSIWILIRILKDELILAYSTASSESVLPRIIEKMEAYGAPASITSFVVPTGYSFNLDGSTLYQSIAAIFIAQLYGIDLSGRKSPWC
jgi:Na+/H+-dicarboxylate symporter